MSPFFQYAGFWAPLRMRVGAYVAFWAAVATLQSVAALQDHQNDGGQRAWEPFLWELSSTLCVALLALAVLAGVGWLRPRPWRQQVPFYALGAMVFGVLHVLGMFGLRHAVYSATGVVCEPSSWGSIRIYEGVKDLVSFALLVGLSHGFWAARASRERERELARVQQQQAAQLALLADQVQPHFLFNSLNLISAVMYEDVPRADRLLCALADLLRQTLAAQARGTHRLADELALVRPFLALMQARFGERLQVHLHASDAAQGWPLPALLLLAPVENAIKHDVAMHSGPVQISLQAEVMDGALHLQIDNSGVAVAEAGPEGLGLRNLRERLQAHYGARARCHFGPHAGGMRLQLVLPRP